MQLLSLFMRGMLRAKTTIFFVFNTTGLLFLVLRRGIISILANRAF